MAAFGSLRRLCEVLRMQEEEARRVSAEAAAETWRLQAAETKAAARARAGRRMVAASAHSGAVSDRVAGLEEIRIAERVLAMLGPRIAAAEREEEARRRMFLARRTERRQAETLLEAAERRQALEDSRRAQQSADDLHLGRQVRAAEMEKG